MPLCRKLLGCALSQVLNHPCDENLLLRTPGVQTLGTPTGDSVWTSFGLSAPKACGDDDQPGTNGYAVNRP